MKKPEILAPAGSMDSLRAAVAAGCDAVYIGGGSFGARAYAQNLSEDEMTRAIRYCHLHGVKIYMTVNTLLKEEERRTLLYDFLLPYYRAGLDAVIVQDVGVMDFVREYFPELAIHASTQMALTMGRGAEELEKYHVSRIVPARELSLEELRQMRKDTSLELEVFVHGALCYCYSGQCLFSSMLGGRSGNRGRCAQPCRMAYRGEDITSGEGEYLLSPRELCNLSYMGELIEAGVDSFKIEGRMKRPEYTAFVTAVYRKYVDNYCSRGKQGYEEYLQTHQREWQEDLCHLAEIYNREGFTHGYLKGETGNVEKRQPGTKGEMLSRRRARHGGVLVGKVVSVGKREVTYEAVEEIFPQDVVEFRDDLGEQKYEYTLGDKVEKGQKVTALYQKGCVIKKGYKVYRTRHGILLDTIRQNYLEKEIQEPISGVFTAKIGQPVMLTIKLGQDVVCCSGDVCQCAKNQPSTREMVEKSLKQTGNSLFFFESLSIDMEENLFLSVGMIKKLRRRAFDELAQQMDKKFCRYTEKSYEYDKIETASAASCRQANPYGQDDKSGMEEYHTGREKKGEPDIAVSVMNLFQLEEAVKNKAVKRIYINTEELSSRQIFTAWEIITEYGKEPCLAMPRIFRKGVWALWENEGKARNSYLRLPWKGYLIRNWESLHFLEEILQVSGERVVLDYHMYVMNEGSYRFWKKRGIGAFTLPLELTGRELAHCSFLGSSELVVYSRIPLMVTAQCMIKNTGKCLCREDGAEEFFFEDSKKRRFFSRNYCRYCYNVIYQEEAMALTQRQWRMLPVGLVRYDFVNELPEEMRKILEGQRPAVFHEGHWTLETV